jgi:N-acyl-D-aspartate/D-glutamate deacylase
MTRPSGSLAGLHQVPPVAGRAWAQVMRLPTLADRVAALKDPTTRAELIDEGVRKGLQFRPEFMFPLGMGELPDYHVANGTSLADLAAAAGKHPVEIVIDRLIESDGRELYNMWYFNRDGETLGRLFTVDHVYPGLGDAGAHAGQICDADAATFYLSYWVRERNLVSLPKAIHQLTQEAAAVLGLIDRGTVEVGRFADLNVFDPAALAPAYPEYVNDFPGGAGRLRVGARGYAATIVNGEVVTEQGAHTGNRPGRVLRQFSRG